MLTKNADASARERLTLIRLFEELRALGYEGGYDAVRRYAKTWSREHASQTESAYVPLSFAPGEACRSSRFAADRNPDRGAGESRPASKTGRRRCGDGTKRRASPKLIPSWPFCTASQSLGRIAFQAAGMSGGLLCPVAAPNARLFPIANRHGRVVCEWMPMEPMETRLELCLIQSDVGRLIPAKEEAKHGLGKTRRRLSAAPCPPLRRCRLCISTSSGSTGHSRPPCSCRWSGLD